MSLRFIAFDAMTKQNKITALMQLLKIAEKEESDYLLALHALTDENMSVYLAAKRIIKTFVGESFFLDLGSQSRDEIKESISDYMAKNIVLAPHLIEIESHSGFRMLSKELQMKQETFESTGNWIGPFASNLCLLNSLRDDTQSLINQIVASDEKLQRAYLCFYDANLAEIRQGKESLDTIGASFKSELSSVRSPGDISPTLGELFKLISAPSYLLFLLSNQRGYIFLREELRETKASVFSFNLTYSGAININEHETLATLEIETPYDILKLPYLNSDDAKDAISFINLMKHNLREGENSEISSNSSSSNDHAEVAETPFDKELRKLDMLLSSKYMNGETFLSHKFDLQHKELEKLVTEDGSVLSGGLVGEAPNTKNVMFIDIIGFTGGPAEKHPLKSSTLIPVHDKIIFPVVKDLNGYVVKKAGDSLIILFETFQSAYDASKIIFTKLNNFNRSKGEKVFARIFINREIVETRGDCISGKAINIAVTMSSLAAFGRVFVVKDLVNDKEAFSKIGSYSIPGYDEFLDLFHAVDVDIEMGNLSTLYLNALELNVGLQVSKDYKVSAPSRKVLEKLEITIETYKKAIKDGLPRNKKIETLLANLRELLKQY